MTEGMPSTTVATAAILAAPQGSRKATAQVLAALAEETGDAMMRHTAAVLLGEVRLGRIGYDDSEALAVIEQKIAAGYSPDLAIRLVVGERHETYADQRRYANKLAKKVSVNNYG
jgi:hypothetical protein